MGLTKTLSFLLARAGQPADTPELASIRPSRRNALLKHGTHESQRYPVMQDTKLFLQLHPCPIEAAAQACEGGGKTKKDIELGGKAPLNPKPQTLSCFAPSPVQLVL